jgi:tripartite-type tricarboxylate transporter receptor subunit TctC
LTCPIDEVEGNDMNPLRHWMTRSLTIASACTVLVLAALTAPAAHAQTYPDRPIKLLVGYPAGGATDTVARLLATKYGELLSQSVVVENRPGASGTIAATALAKAPADGYTLLVNTGADSVIAPITLKELQYVPERDLAPITLLSIVPSVMVVPANSPYRSVGEIVAAARTQPGRLNYASFGNGSSAHMAAELLKSVAGIDITHVPFKGSAPAVTELLAGRVDFMFDTVASSRPHIQSGRVRALAVTSAQRLAAAQQVPTMQEAGVDGYVSQAFLGLLAPAGTPKPVIDRLQAETVKILGMNDVKQRLADLGMVPSPMTPAEFAGFMSTETARYRKLIHDAKLNFAN